MREDIKNALETDRLIDITTVGRKSGQLRKIEIGFHRVDGELFITGTPGPRSWLANLKANPRFTFHIKQSLQVELQATAEIVYSEAERWGIFSKMSARRFGRQPMDVRAWVKASPLVRVNLE